MKETSRNNGRLHRKRRIRAKVFGTAQRPRLSVFRSLTGMFVQVIDDEAKKTIASVSSREVAGKYKKNDVSRAAAIGELVAKKCAEKKVGTVVFDRSGYKFHGKVKAVADGARKAGLII